MQSGDAQLHKFGEVLEQYSFSIPDYQRGYSWGEVQWEALWRDMKNVAGSGAEQHFTGMMLLRKGALKRGVQLAEVVDGQQRLLTVMLLANALRVRTGAKPTRYALCFQDNKEFQAYFDFYVLCDARAEAQLTREPSSYALNLKSASEYFNRAVGELSKEEAAHLLDVLLGKFCLFILAVSPSFDIHVAFETLNNRGRLLSKMELLKNRLIYLTTVVAQPGDDAEALRHQIHRAWKGVYRALGRSDKTQHQDDEFLMAHSTAYFKRKRDANWLETVLFHEVFAPGVKQTTFGFIRKYIHSLECAAIWWSHIHAPALMPPAHQQQLSRLEHCGFAFFKPLILSAYLRASANVLGATSAPQEHAQSLSSVEKLLGEVERFVVVILRLSGGRATLGRADMESAAYTLLEPGRDGFLVEEYGMDELDDHAAIDLVARLVRAWVSNDETAQGGYDDDDFPWLGLFSHSELQTNIDRRFQNGDGFYKWDFTRLALYEYEASFHNNGNNPLKLAWSDFHFDETVEHIFPQNPSGQGEAYWGQRFYVDGRSDVNKRITKALQNSLGNLLLLSRSANGAASNEAYTIKLGRTEKGKRSRYENCSYSATEVAQVFREWDAQNIAVRGVALLKFVEKRWDIKLSTTPDDLKSYLALCFGQQAQAIREGKAGAFSTRSLKPSLSAKRVSVRA
ncbi:DUF262 domain-containing protein [Pseudomonas sp. P39-UII1]|uniref:GmrSD restriction endonuclease domain-containing protein n=1 Tax=Pseudomonas sp. P39-UII1 TaxID=3080333 RepID=UPI003207F1E2